MAERGAYKTKQRALVSACLRTNADRYLTVDEVWASVVTQGGSVGRTTVYRTLESLASNGEVMKIAGTAGESRYRLAPEAVSGQLVCLGCGRAYALDCGMVQEFAEHVSAHHGFKIESTRTVLYGLCPDCREDSDAR